MAQSCRYRIDGDARISRHPGESVEHRLDGIFTTESAPHRETGVVPYLSVHDAVSSKILARLIRNTRDGIRRLHYGRRMVECLEVPLERPGFSLEEPEGKGIRIGCGQVGVSVGIGDLKDRLDTQATIEVLMENRFGQFGPRPIVRRCWTRGDQ